MPHFTFSNISLSTFSPKQILSSRRTRKSSTASAISNIASTTSAISVTSSTVYHRRHDSTESITSLSTAPSSAMPLEIDEDDLLAKIGIINPYAIPSGTINFSRPLSSQSSPSAVVAAAKRRNATFTTAAAAAAHPFGQPRRQNTNDSICSSSSSIASGLAAMDMCGFHYAVADDVLEERFRPELSMMEPRPVRRGTRGIMETLERERLAFMPIRI